jgi:hypothetical protein
MTMREACLSDLELDVLLAVELPAADDERGSAHLAACTRCAARLADLERARLAFEAMGLRLEDGPGSRAVPARQPRFRRVGAAGALAAALGSVLAFGGLAGLGSDGDAARTGARHERRETPPAPAGVRSKGAPLLDLFIRHDGRLREAGDREPVHAEDQLQFAYSSSAPGYVTVLSRDGAGVVSVYVPSDAAVMAPAPTGERVHLPESTILDDTLGREDVYALFCAKGLELEPLTRALRERGALEAPEGCSLRRIELDKRERPRDRKRR